MWCLVGFPLTEVVFFYGLSHPFVSLSSGIGVQYGMRFCAQGGVGCYSWSVCVICWCWLGGGEGVHELVIVHF